jgi:hypothetical protein
MSIPTTSSGLAQPATTVSTRWTAVNKSTLKDSVDSDEQLPLPPDTSGTIHSSEHTATGETANDLNSDYLPRSDPSLPNLAPALKSHSSQGAVSGRPGAAVSSLAFLFALFALIVQITSSLIFPLRHATVPIPHPNDRTNLRAIRTLRSYDVLG